MRWNCPHCNVALQVPNDSLGSGWSFSRCYQCRGFALVRRAEVDVIKINGPPPQALTDSTAVADTAELVAHRSLKKQSDARGIPGRPTAVQSLASALGSGSFPSPLPETPAPRSILNRLVPFTLALLAVAGVGGGIHRSLESQGRPEARAPTEPVRETVDQVRHSAMAPSRPSEYREIEAPASERPAIERESN